MASQRRKIASVQTRVRLDQASHDFAMARAKEARFNSLSKYVQWLIWREKSGADGPMAQLEEKLSKSLLQTRQEVRQAQLSAEGANAFLHALAKFLMVTLPELPADDKQLLQATAANRYSKLLTQAGKELASRVDEEELDAELS